jgi:hypothetical protein
VAGNHNTPTKPETPGRHDRSEEASSSNPSARDRDIESSQPNPSSQPKPASSSKGADPSEQTPHVPGRPDTSQGISDPAQWSHD